MLTCVSMTWGEARSKILGRKVSRCDSQQKSPTPNEVGLIKLAKKGPARDLMVIFGLQPVVL